MKFTALPNNEDRFQAEAASQLTAFSVQVPDEVLTLKGQVYKPKTTDYYFQVEHPKQKIVLHFTAGNLRSDMMSLTQQSRHVSVPFVIARNGTVYQLFPSKHWSGHIGAGVGNTSGNPQDKISIGIELSNYGFLVPKEGNLETIYSRVPNGITGKPNPIDIYCTAAETEAYVKLSTPFREQSFYPTYTSQQVNSLIILLRFLTKKYNIPRTFLPENTRYITTNDVINFSGIVSHINFRSSGKWDIGKAFDWDTLISGVEAASYMSTAPATRDFFVGISTEKEIDAIFPKTKALIIQETETTDNEGYDPFDYENK